MNSGKSRERILPIFPLLIRFVIGNEREFADKLKVQTNAYAKDNSINWTSRDDWTNCNGLCGETGHMYRHRVSAIGEFDREWKTCHIMGCTISNYSKIVEGNALREQELNRLVQIAGTVNRVVLEKCILDYCDRSFVNSVFADNADQFWNALLCVKHNVGCPVKGCWSKWSSWSKCTASCGPGIQYRLRYCNNPTPSRTSLNCSGDFIEFQNCFGKLCTANINSSWCNWSKWSKCSVRQGNGIVVRKRFCRHFNNSSYTSCFGPHTEISQCYILDVDGGWSEWQTWSPCSENCGKGTRHRMRSCSRPESERFGQKCCGEFIQTSNCYVEPCKGPQIMVATFDKSSKIEYAATGINITLLHVVMRFYSFDAFGTLLQQINNACTECSRVQLSLINFRLTLTVILDGCNSTLLSSSTINTGWNDVSFTVTKTKITLRLNNNQISNHVKCITSTINFDQVMNVGEYFEGYIEKLMINFVPYALTVNNKFSDMYLPYTTYNTVFELSEEPSYSDLSKTYKIPCFYLNTIWKLELYLKFKFPADGDLLLIKNTLNNYMLIQIVNNIIKLKVKLDDYFDETSIKIEEIDSSWIHLDIEQQVNVYSISVNGEKRTLIMSADISNELCKNNFYIGNSEANTKSIGFHGIIGYLKINNNVFNANDFLVYDLISQYNSFSYNLDILYNEVTVNDKEDTIELYCIINDKLEYEDLDIVWLKSNEPILHETDCNISNNCVVTTYEFVSQISIFPKNELDDYFYLCVSKSRQKIICAFGIKSFQHFMNTPNILKTFIIIGNLMVTIIILFILIIINKAIKYN